MATNYEQVDQGDMVYGSKSSDHDNDIDVARDEQQAIENNETTFSDNTLKDQSKT